MTQVMNAVGGGMNLWLWGTDTENSDLTAGSLQTLTKLDVQARNNYFNGMYFTHTVITCNK